MTRSGRRIRAATDHGTPAATDEEAPSANDTPGPPYPLLFLLFPRRRASARPSGSRASRRRTIDSSIVLLALLAIGCIHESEVLFHTHARVLPEDGDFAVATGSNIVLEVNRFKGRILADVATSYAFYLEIDESLLEEGKTLAVPSDGVRPYLWILNAPAEHVTEDCRGSIEILEVGKDRLIAKVDVISDEHGWLWRLKERLSFTNTPE